MPINLDTTSVVNRPIQHQLETKSRTAFESSLPSVWVYRVVNPDYGLDGLVEIFTENGKATGEFFFVQLKATGKEDIGHTLAIRLPLEKAEYYDTLNIPVLIVLFHASSGRLFAKWFDLPPTIKGFGHKKSISFEFLENDELSKDRCFALTKDLKNLHKTVRLARREERIARYYEAKSKIDLWAKPSQEESEYVYNIANEEVVFHDAFGRGIVEKATEYFFFVKFEDDKILRKFDPGDCRGFVKL